MNYLTKSSVCLALLGALAAGCGGPSAAVDSGATGSLPPPELELDGVGLKFFRGSVLKAVGHAQAATLERGSGDFTARRLTMRFLEVEAGKDAELKAAEAVGNLRGQFADAAGGVRLVDADGNVGLTERAHVDARGKRAIGWDPVEVLGRGLRSNAKGGFSLEFADPGALVLHGPTTTQYTGQP